MCACNFKGIGDVLIRDHRPGKVSTTESSNKLELSRQVNNEEFQKRIGGPRLTHRVDLEGIVATVAAKDASSCHEAQWCLWITLGSGRS